MLHYIYFRRPNGFFRLGRIFNLYFPMKSHFLFIKNKVFSTRIAATTALFKLYYNTKSRLATVKNSLCWAYHWNNASLTICSLSQFITVYRMKTIMSFLINILKFKFLILILLPIIIIVKA